MITWRIWGLHPVDVFILGAYLVGMLYIGHRLSRTVKRQSDFYLAGRKLGKLFQFFLNFGKMTDGNGAVSTASVVFRQGIGGVWIALQTLFMTPYYWFMNAWFRRVRLVTVADLFEDRFGGKLLAAMYAAFYLGVAVMSIGLGYQVSAKTMEAMMVKPQADYTAQEQRMVDDYKEYKELKSQYEHGTLALQNRQRYETLRSLYHKEKVRSFISYIHRPTFYVIYGSIVGIYIILGGFSAAVITDAFQAVLIVVFSLLLIPFGLSKIGGVSALHEKVPDYMFNLFGSVSTSEYTWYSILAILFSSIVQIHAVDGNMAVGGSAKNELAASMGAVTGGFAKRLMIIAWSLCALLAIGLYGKSISDADTTWGVLTHNLLVPGTIGLMLAGILAANMSSLDARAITLSALFVRNLYAPIRPDRSERHYILVGRITAGCLLAMGVFVAMGVTDIIALLKVLITIGVTFGAPVLLIFFWRRLTKAAVTIEVICVTVLIVIMPWVVPIIPGAKQSAALVKKTHEQTVLIETRATSADVTAGRAKSIAETITKSHVIEPVSCFWDSVVHADPYDPESPLEGQGRFNMEVFMVSLLGIDVQGMTPAGLMTARFLFDGIFPFVLLFLFSYLTKRTDKRIVDRFYVKMKTPVAATPEADDAELAKSHANPDRFDHLKLFPSSNWEMCKWTRRDVIGFSLSWVVVGAILALFWLLLRIGK